MEISYTYMMKRNRFGKQAQFCEYGPEMCDSIPVNKKEHGNYLLRNPMSQASQNVPVYSQHSLNTIRAEFADLGVNHAEGGWPKDIAAEDPETTQRYRRRVEKDEDYIKAVFNCCPGLQHYVHQNNAVDLYRAYFSELPALPSGERVGMRTVNVFRDPHARPVSSVCWQPLPGGRVAVSYVHVDFSRTSMKPLEAFIWDMENNNAPEAQLTPHSPIYDLRFNPQDRNLLAGALGTGQVGMWDLRAGGTAVRCCEPHVAHRDLCRKVLFIHSKNGMEIFSGSPDGCLKWWDLRKLNEPTDEVIIDLVTSATAEQSMATALGVSSMQYEPTIPTRYMVGTETGAVVGGNRKGKTPMEKLPLKFDAHEGPVLTVQRHPFFPKNFLSVGDYTARIWSEECRESAVIWSPPLRHRLTCGDWSPVRVSVMMLCTGNGRVLLWDLLRSQHRAVLEMQVCDNALTAMEFQSMGGLVALGSSAGPLYLTELSPDLTDSAKQDRQFINASMERETKRERILEARRREIKLKMRQDEEMSPTPSMEEVDATLGDHDLADASAEYFAVVKKELSLF